MVLFTSSLESGSNFELEPRLGPSFNFAKFWKQFISLTIDINCKNIKLPILYEFLLRKSI